MFTIFVINPGSTSTKLALYQGAEDETPVLRCQETIRHSAEELSRHPRPQDQLELRLEAARRFLTAQGTDSIQMLSARGGLVKPLASGCYGVNEAMLEDLRGNRFGAHASNLGAQIAHALAGELRCPAMIADPVGVDEFTPLARYTGFPGMLRRSQSHTLNIRATAGRLARELGRSLESLRLVVAHLGGGISIAPLHEGRILDVNNANDGGPFSAQRCGSLPTTQLVELAFSGLYRDASELNRVLTTQSGLLGLLGSDDLREVIRRIEAGDERAQEVLRAMAYQIAKEIGAMATVLYGRVDRILLTGGLAHPPLTDWIGQRTDWIAPLRVYPGEDEMLALAEAGLRVLLGREALKEY